MGELSTVWLALEGAQFAPGDDATQGVDGRHKETPVHTVHRRGTPRRGIQWMKIDLRNMCGVPEEEQKGGLSDMLADYLQPMLDTSRDIIPLQCWLADTLPLPKWNPSGSKLEGNQWRGA